MREVQPFAIGSGELKNGPVAAPHRPLGPEQHEDSAGVSPDRIRRRAAAFGQQTGELAEDGGPGGAER